MKGDGVSQQKIRLSRTTSSLLHLHHSPIAVTTPSTPHLPLLPSPPIPVSHTTCTTLNYTHLHLTHAFSFSFFICIFAFVCHLSLSDHSPPTPFVLPSAIPVTNSTPSAPFASPPPILTLPTLCHLYLKLHCSLHLSLTIAR